MTNWSCKHIVIIAREKHTIIFACCLDVQKSGLFGGPAFCSQLELFEGF